MSHPSRVVTLQVGELPPMAVRLCGVEADLPTRVKHDPLGNPTGRETAAPMSFSCEFVLEGTVPVQFFAAIEHATVRKALRDDIEAACCAVVAASLRALCWTPEEA